MANTSNTSEQRPTREKIDPTRIEFKRLSAACRRGVFSCDYVHIDDFFNNRAMDEHESLLSRTVTAHLDGDDAPAGFYTMAIASEPADQFAEEQSFLAGLKSQLLGRQLTTVQLIWVAVHSSVHRRGIGTLLMGHALDDFYQVVDRTGVVALTLKPISANARMFYDSIGFKPYGSEKRMLLSALAVMAARTHASARSHS